MSERLRESVSALMDDEADDLELGRVLREAERDPTVREVWSRYHLISAAMRGQANVPAGWRTPDAVAVAPEGDSDATPEVGFLERLGFRDGAGRRSRKAVVGVAAAASVALAMVLTLQQWDAGEVAGGAEVATTSGTAAQPSTAAAASRGDAWDPAVQAVDGAGVQADGGALRDAKPAVAQQVEAYMLRHAEQNALNSRNSVMPMAKVAAFDAE